MLIRIRCFCALFAFVLVASLNTIAQQPLVKEKIDDSVRVQLHGNVHPLARSEFDQGQVPDSQPLNRMLLIMRRSPEQEAALHSLILGQQDANSSHYHQWLSPNQFGIEFGPADSDVEAVTQWLQSGGFKVGRVAASRMFIEFSGTSGQIKQAFRSPIHRYLVNGNSYFANSEDLSIPLALVPVVAGVDSLNSFPRAAQNKVLGSRSIHGPVPADAGALYTYPGQYGTNYAVTPYDFAAIYDLLPLWNAANPIRGTGETIAIVARSDIDPQDAPAFWNLFGLDGTNMSAPTLVRTIDGPNPGKTGDEVEADIDTQWSGAVAPGATINIVVDESTETTDGVDLSALYIVDHNLAPIMSESYGACEKSMGSGGVQFYSSLWEQAAAQGISVFVATGDNGAAGCDNPSTVASNGLNVSGIASTQFNVAVGGTDFNQYGTWSNYWNATNSLVTNQSVKGYIPETSWNDSCTNLLLSQVSGGTTQPENNCNNATFKGFLESIAGSGGVSTSWLKPEWQVGTPSDSARDLPDVSLFASNGFLNSFYVICQYDRINEACNLGLLEGLGGTSVSSPAMAGIMALVDQKAGGPQGNPNLLFYKLAANHSPAFHDVPAGSTNSVPCQTGTQNCATKTTGDKYGILSGYNSAAGYDLVTGIGSIDAANLVTAWTSVSFSTSNTTLTLNGGSAASVIHGTAVPVTIAVTPSAATGDAVLMVSSGRPGPGIQSFHLTSGVVNGTTSLLPGGTYSVMAHYSGDATYGGSYSNAVPVIVTPESSVVLPNLVTLDQNGHLTSHAASSATYGNGFALFRVDVGDAAATTGSSGIVSHCSQQKASCPTGTVTLRAPGTALDGLVLSLNSEGYTEVQTLSPGSYSVTAQYSGDASYNASSGSVNFTIAKAPTTITAGFAGTPVEYGNQEQIAADALTNSTGVAPTGTFQFYVDGQPAGNPQNVYESSGYSPTSSALSYAWADAQTTWPFMPVGQHTLYASYSGDANYASGTSATVSVPVSQASTGFSTWGWLTYGATINIGQTINAEGTISGSAYGVAPTGTMTFMDNGVPISGTVTYSGKDGTGLGLSALSGTISYTAMIPGTHSLTISYSGDNNYLPATTPLANNMTVAAQVSLQSGADITIASPGQSGSTTIVLNPNQGFTGGVTLSCTPPPSAAETTCGFRLGTSGDFTPTLLATVNGSTTVSFQVTTTAPHQISTLVKTGTAGLAVAGLLCWFAPFRQRRRMRGIVIFAVLAAVTGLVSCGGGGGSSGGGGGGRTDLGTQAGFYIYTITGAIGSGANQVTTTTNVNVKVQ